MNDKSMNPLLKETFVFRPIDAPMKGTAVTFGYKHEGQVQGFLRYADGTWIPDDGKPDLAFIHGVIAYGMSMPDYTNILWSWRDLPLAQSLVGQELARHTRGWHFQTVNNEEWRNHHWDHNERDKHPNTIAYVSAMKKCSSIHGVANGRGPYLTHEDELTPYFTRGLVWVQRTMQPIATPASPVCFLCLNDGLGHRKRAFERQYEDRKSSIEYTKERADKLEIDLIDSRDELEHHEKALAELRGHPLYDPQWDADEEEQ